MIGMRVIPFFVTLLLLILLCPASAVTVASNTLKWSETNVHGTVANVYYIDGVEEGTVEFSQNLQGICTADPAVVRGSGNVTVSCSPRETVYGYARFSEPSGGSVQTGIRVPVALSIDSAPAVEMPEPAITIPVQEAPAVKAPGTRAPEVTAPAATAAVPVSEEPKSPIMFVLAGMIILVVVFGAVVVYDWRRGLK